jgi:hypothetical protein
MRGGFSREKSRLEGRNPRRGRRLRGDRPTSLGKTDSLRTDLLGASIPEPGRVVKSAVDAVFFGTSRKRSSEGPAKAEGVGRDESRSGYREGEPPENLNPMDGFGMK